MALAAEALGRLVADQVPLPLRRLASFAPARRARLGGERILEAAEADEAFRGRLAVQARAVVPEAGAELDAGDADSLDAAALAWLERPDGWQDVVARAAESGRAREEEAAVRAADERADRLQRRLDDASDELKAARQKARDDLDALRADNTDLRRKLGESRRQAKDAVAATDALRRTTEEAVWLPAPRRPRQTPSSDGSAPGSPTWSSGSRAPSANAGSTATARASGRGCCWTRWSTPPPG